MQKRNFWNRAYLAVGRRVWPRIPAAWRSSRLVHAYGRQLYQRVCRYEPRRMSIGTFFLRNRPEMDCMVRVLSAKPPGAEVKVAVLACSKGAEVYSVAFALRTARPDLKIFIQASDLSPEVLAVAREGRYSLKDMGGMRWPDTSLIAQKGQLTWDTWKGQDTSIFERLTPAEMETLFDRQGEEVVVKPRFRQDITWQLGDAADPQFPAVLGPQDIVVANRFLCHLDPEPAERCLRNLGRMVKPGGHLFVSGVDLDVRTRVARQSGWQPVPELLREIHEGDSSLTLVWPWNYCGVEPFDSRRSDWKMRYAAVFQLNGKTSHLG